MWHFHEDLIADFAQLFRVTAKNFLNFLHIQISLKSFSMLFRNLYIEFVVMIR